MSLNHVFQNGYYESITPTVWTELLQTVEGSSGLFDNNIVTNVATQGSVSNGVVSIGVDANKLVSTMTSGNEPYLIAIGQNALQAFVTTNNANQVVIGSNAGTQLNVGSDYNVVVGNQSLADPGCVASSGNVVIGNYSGQAIQDGNENIVIGKTDNGRSELISGPFATKK